MPRHAQQQPAYGPPNGQYPPQQQPYAPVQ